MGLYLKFSTQFIQLYIWVTLATKGKKHNYNTVILPQYTKFRSGSLFSLELYIISFSILPYIQYIFQTYHLYKSSLPMVWSIMFRFFFQIICSPVNYLNIIVVVIFLVCFYINAYIRLNIYFSIRRFNDNISPIKFITTKYDRFLCV